MPRIDTVVPSPLRQKMGFPGEYRYNNEARDTTGKGMLLLQYLKMDLIAVCMAVTTLISLPSTPNAPALGMSVAPKPQATTFESVPSKKPAVTVRMLSKALHPLRLAGTGMASWYGSVWNGRKTASGEPFDETLLTACHRTLPFGTQVKVTDTHSGKSVVVRINDRGTMTPSRIIDLSSGAARKLGIMNAGVAKVRLEILDRVENPASNRQMPL